MWGLFSQVLCNFASRACALHIFCVSYELVNCTAIARPHLEPDTPSVLLRGSPHALISCIFLLCVSQLKRRALSRWLVTLRIVRPPTADSSGVMHCMSKRFLTITVTSGSQEMAVAVMTNQVMTTAVILGDWAIAHRSRATRH